MSANKFIDKVKESLGLEGLENSSKKKSMKNLLKKLNTKKEKLDKSLNEKISKKVKKELEEEREIVVCQIKKGKKILEKLNDK
ncbi:MAG: hypothetical protein U9R16_02655 [Campylobacterota bacterium]|nr:hypothetical protein [Campylobacterota bacterium]